MVDLYSVGEKNNVIVIIEDGDDMDECYGAEIDMDKPVPFKDRVYSISGIVVSEYGKIIFEKQRR